MKQIHLPNLTKTQIEDVEKAVELCHTEEYRLSVKERCSGLKEKQTSPEKEKDVYYSKDSYTAALLAA